MYFITKITKKKTKVVCFDSFDGFKYVTKGTTVFQINNGTIGQGARYKNYLISDVLKVLQSETFQN